MATISIALSKLFDGWDGYQTSILHAIQPLTQDQLTWRPATLPLGGLAGSRACKPQAARS